MEGRSNIVATCHLRDGEKRLISTGEPPSAGKRVNGSADQTQGVVTFRLETKGRQVYASKANWIHENPSAEVVSAGHSYRGYCGITRSPTRCTVIHRRN